MSRILIVGIEAAQVEDLTEMLRPFSDQSLICEALPRLALEGERLYAESPRSGRWLEVDRVIFHGIYAEDEDFLSALALWAGPCFPKPAPMLAVRRRLASLLAALRLTRFPGARRGYLSREARFDFSRESVAKWGNWHCGEDKARFQGFFEAPENCLVEPFVKGEAVRLVLVDEPRQVRMTGSGWLKSIHGPGAELMAVCPELQADSLEIQRGLGLDILANDYIIGPEGPVLLELNHIPSVTAFPELWQDYKNRLRSWLRASS